VEAEWLLYDCRDPTARPEFPRLRALAEGSLPAGGTVTFEPGGQVEISTRPGADLDAVLDGLAADTRALGTLLAEAGCRGVPAGVDTLRAPRRILGRPRYQAMESFFDADRGAGRWMMCNTASLQVNVSHDSEDPDRRWRLLHRLAPVLIATFANSPGRDAAGEAWASMRQGIWWSMDRGRTRPPPERGGSPARAWAEYALAADVMLIRTGESALPLTPGFSFERWLLSGHSAGWPTRDDLLYHMTTLFPPVRPRGWLELRVLDALPASVREVAVLVVAAAVQPAAAAALERALPDTSWLWPAAARRGLAHPGLAAASSLLFEVAIEALPAVTGRAERIEAVAAYAGQYVARRRQPRDGTLTREPMSFPSLR
jgi:glutamate--cysteine ligase